MKTSQFPLLLLLMTITGSARADMTAYERDNLYSLAFTDTNSFSDAVFNGEIDQWFTGNPGDSFNESWNYVGTVDSWHGNGTDLSVSDITFPTANSMNGTINDLSGLASPAVIDFHAGAGSGAFQTGVFQNFNVLSVHSNGPGGVVDGGLYYWQMILPGDWSNQGLATGDSQLVSYNVAGGWDILDDFTFDSGTDTTTLSFENVSYLNDGSHNIGVTFRLIGSAVPEPAMCIPFALGILGLLRRNRRPRP